MLFEFSHETLTYFSKSWGLLYMIAFSVGVLIYALRPSKKESFERAANQILDDEDKPCP